MNSLTLAIRILEGKPALTDKDRVLLKEFTDKHEGMGVEFILREPKTKRSIQQNKYMWGVVYEYIAKEIGETAEYVHELMKHKFLREPMLFGDEEIMITKSTAKLSVQGMETFIAKVKDWALSFLSITIPEPNQVDYDELQYTKED